MGDKKKIISRLTIRQKSSECKYILWMNFYVTIQLKKSSHVNSIRAKYKEKVLSAMIGKNN